MLADSSGALQAKSQGNSDMIDRLDVRCRLMELQQRLVSNLEASSSQVPLCVQPCHNHLSADEAHKHEMTSNAHALSHRAVLSAFHAVTQSCMSYACRHPMTSDLRT